MLTSQYSLEWISGDDGLTMTWSGGDSGAFTLLQTTLQNPEKFQEIASRSQDGTAYYAVLNVRLAFTQYFSSC